MSPCAHTTPSQPAGGSAFLPAPRRDSPGGRDLRAGSRLSTEAGAMGPVVSPGAQVQLPLDSRSLTCRRSLCHSEPEFPQPHNTHMGTVLAQASRLLATPSSTALARRPRPAALHMASLLSAGRAQALWCLLARLCLLHLQCPFYFVLCP